MCVAVLHAFEYSGSVGPIPPPYKPTSYCTPSRSKRCIYYELRIQTGGFTFFGKIFARSTFGLSSRRGIEVLSLTKIIVWCVSVLWAVDRTVD
jgi:hypothetical protein